MKRTKTRVSKKGRKSIKNKTRVNRRRLRGGNCGYEGLMLGGNSLAALPVHNYYPQNNFQHDQSYIRGGKKRMIRGGMSNFLNELPNMGVVGGMGFSNGATIQPDLITGNRQYFS